MDKQLTHSLDVTEIKRIFHFVCGRDPNPDEHTMLADLSTLPGDQYLQAFRAILSRINRLIIKTPFSVRFSADDLSYLPMDGYVLATDKQDIAVSLPLALGIYETQLRKFYRERLKPGMTFLDIGANIGLYSLLAASLVGDQGRVLSFEPNSENCRLILLGAEKNGFKNIRVFPLALSDANGHAFFTTHIGSNGGLQPRTEDLLSDGSCVVIPTVRLDDFVKERVDFIKIDVEGAEGLVVAGAHGLIERDRPTITSEFSMEMIPRVSGISCREYLGYFQSIDYEIFLVGKETGELTKIDDVQEFLDSYGSLARIEDLAFIPAAAP